MVCLFVGPTSDSGVFFTCMWRTIISILHLVQASSLLILLQVSSVIERYSPILEDISVSEMEDWACIKGKKKVAIWVQIEHHVQIWREQNWLNSKLWKWRRNDYKNGEHVCCFEKMKHQLLKKKAKWRTCSPPNTEEEFVSWCGSTISGFTKMISLHIFWWSKFPNNLTTF